MLKDIAVFYDVSHEGKHILETAAVLAEKQNARLIGITATNSSDIESYPSDSFARGAGIGEVISRLQSSTAAHLLHAAQALKEVADRHGVTAEFRAIPWSESGVEMSLHSLYCDLLVVNHPKAPGAPFAWSSIDVLQQTGVPLLIVPQSWRSIQLGQRITVAWNASRQARRAVADALPLLISAEAVDLLIVDPERKAELHGEEPGADMGSYLARHGVRVNLERIDSADKPVADVILEHAVKAKADLIVFDAYSRPKLSELVLGGVSRTLLSSVPLPLFVSH
ncbi:MAG TPA: universal stress protein [Pseudomonas sp.]